MYIPGELAIFLNFSNFPQFFHKWLLSFPQFLVFRNSWLPQVSDGPCELGAPKMSMSFRWPDPFEVTSSCDTKFAKTIAHLNNKYSMLCYVNLCIYHIIIYIYIQVYIYFYIPILLTVTD